MEMNDPEWTQGIQETAITLQYKRMDDQKSKKNDEVVRYIKKPVLYMYTI